jgi:hypothetical protein
MIGGYGYVNMENTRDYCTTCMVPNMHSTHGELLHGILFVSWLSLIHVQYRVQIRRSSSLP